MRIVVMKRICLLILMMVFGTLLSCSTLTREQCMEIDWQERGKSDGMKGETTEKFAQYQKTCLGHEINIIKNKGTYLFGRTEGLKLFCTEDSGYSFGSNGGSYNGVCAGVDEKIFLRGFNMGLRLYEVRNKERELKEREEKLEKKETARFSSQLKNLNECSFNSDCQKRGRCSFAKCENSGRSCHFDSDCSIEGRCHSTFDTIDGRSVSVNKCHY